MRASTSLGCATDQIEQEVGRVAIGTHATPAGLGTTTAATVVDTLVEVVRPTFGNVIEAHGVAHEPQ